MRKGFSIVELMITVAIMGILAAVAVPRLNEMVLKARKAEAATNLRGIGDSAIAYQVAYSTWVTAASNPGAPLGKTLRAFRPAEPGWSSLGWRPDGLVRCTYMITGFGGDTWARADAYCDVDDNNDSCIVRYYVPSVEREGYFSDLYPNRY